MMFAKNYKKDNDDMKLSEGARKKIASKLAEEENGKIAKSTAFRFSHAVALSIAFMVGIWAILPMFNTPTEKIDQSESSNGSPQPVANASYKEIYKIIDSLAVNYGYNTGGGMLISEDVSIFPAPKASDERRDFQAMTEAEKSSDFSETNVQVQGVDEADIIKTDGKYIYMITDGELVIASARGKDSKVVSKVKAYLANESSYPVEMFLSEGKLVLFLAEHNWVAYPSNPLAREKADWTGSRTMVAIFDVSDPAKPTEISRTGQDGTYLTSRMLGGNVYLATTHFIYGQPNLSNPSTFVPNLYIEDSSREAMKADCIVIPEIPTSTAYIVLTSMDGQTGKHIDKKSLLGYTSTVFMSHGSLVVAQSVSEQKLVEESFETPYKIEHHANVTNTHFVRFALDEGKLELAGEFVAPGELLNQFSFDEHNGYFRFVTTVYSHEFKTYTDEAHGFQNYEYIDTSQTNALYTYDLDGNLVGSITGLAEDERVYSVRFSGDVGYFVTFRQVDPLFAVDLSDPKNPKVLSELKIPGFSQYLHVFGDGLLFGLGMEADPLTGRTNGMKLSMFDVSDPFDIWEKHKLAVDASYSQALYNHKAILIMVERGIIAFPAGNGYVVYEYTTYGFEKKAEMDVSNAYDSRGVIIGDELYICSTKGMSIFDLLTFRPIGSIKF
ncbi:MAG: beta-propeller domain-containing protein [Eubacteriaceae bacterium]|nr:beta-propeller domain-containing protein [Eubacteriaceae bacterium]